MKLSVSKFSKLSLVSSLVGLSFVAISCSSTKKSEDSATSSAGGEASAGMKPEQAQPVVVQTPQSSPGMKTIYFDFNKFNIRADQMPNADMMADALKAKPSLKVRIEGNTDDRGSTEYNMALGTRRADSLKKYFLAHGVSADNISTVSYGKERPAVLGEDESAWAKNRRDDVVEVK